MGAFFLSTKFWVLGKLDWHRLRAKIKSRSAKSCSGRIKTSFFLGEKILFWSRCLVQMRCLRGNIFFQAPELTSNGLSDMVPFLLWTGFWALIWVQEDANNYWSEWKRSCLMTKLCPEVSPWEHFFKLQKRLRVDQESSFCLQFR